MGLSPSDATHWSMILKRAGAIDNFEATFFRTGMVKSSTS